MCASAARFFSVLCPVKTTFFRINLMNHISSLSLPKNKNPRHRFKGNEPCNSFALKHMQSSKKEWPFGLPSLSYFMHALSGATSVSVYIIFTLGGRGLVVFQALLV